MGPPLVGRWTLRSVLQDSEDSAQLRRGEVGRGASGRLYRAWEAACIFVLLPFPGSGPAGPAPSQQEASLSPRRPEPGKEQQISRGGDTEAL